MSPFKSGSAQQTPLRDCSRLKPCRSTTRSLQVDKSAYVPLVVSVRPRSAKSWAVRALFPTLGPFVTCEELYRYRKDVAILDVRGSVDTTVVEPGVERAVYKACYDDYLQGHIPGAVFWDWTVDGIDEDHKDIVQLQLDPDAFAACVEAKGVGTDKPVVIYDNGPESGNMFAARVWWSLRVHGHPEPKILMGGWHAWKEYTEDKIDGFELYEPCTLKVMDLFEGTLHPELYASKQDVLDVLTQHQGRQQQSGAATTPIILDVRSAVQFSGTVRRSKHGGRVPGSVSLPYKRLLSRPGEMHDVETLRAIFRDIGVAEERDVVVYCNGGVSACVAATALEVCGFDQWRIYDGSWNEWGNDDSVPIEV